MSDIRASQPIPMRVSKLMAEMHYFMAKEMIERLGEKEGTEAVLSAINKMAASRVEAMHKDAEEQGIEPWGKANYMKIKDFATPDWKRDEKGIVTYCPMQETWAQYGEEGLKIGALYCAIDYPLYEGFGMKLDRPECLTTPGQHRCVFNYTMMDKEDSHEVK
ncbi:MAG: L-2-amino-thiazoline-4-carboxylic acid hydrolase [Clostridiales bacterium]